MIHFFLHQICIVSLRTYNYEVLGEKPHRFYHVLYIKKLEKEGEIKCNGNKMGKKYKYEQKSRTEKYANKTKM